MSEVSQGPGWWLASDGKWYAPHLHPSYAPPPPPPSASGTLFDQSPTTTWSPSPWSYPAPNEFSPRGAWQAPSPPGTVDPVLFLPLAPWWKRLIAITIDGFVMGTGFFVIVLLIGLAANSAGQGASSTSRTTSGGTVLVGLIIIYVFALIPSAVYYGVMNGSKRGQTVGKMAMSIAVRDARTGAKIGFWRALGRFLITGVFTALFYVPYIIDSLAPLWDKRRQAWHDKVAHSIVVDLKP